MQVYVSADLSEDTFFYTKSKNNLREMNIPMGEKTQHRLGLMKSDDDEVEDKNKLMRAPKIRKTTMRESNESYDFN